MRFIKRLRSAFTGAALLAGCSTPLSPDSSADKPPTRQADAPPPAPPAPLTSATPAKPSAPAAADIKLPAPSASRSWAELRLQAAHRMVAANPNGSYTGTVPDPLLAIPVLEIELNRDGSIRRIQVLRKPRQAEDTTQLAIAAVHRAAPFGDVSRLPKPWLFSETFLFNDERKFKPRTLD